MNACRCRDMFHRTRNGGIFFSDTSTRERADGRITISLFPGLFRGGFQRFVKLRRIVCVSRKSGTGFSFFFLFTVFVSRGIKPGMGINRALRARARKINSTKPNNKRNFSPVLFLHRDIALFAEKKTNSRNVMYFNIVRADQGKRILSEIRQILL